ncbi:MAG: peptidase M23 [Pseudomonadota bacterium]
MRILLLVAALLLPVEVIAKSDVVDRARAASDKLETATEQLKAAGSARDRVSALTATILAFEDGLRALRSGVRQAEAREAELTAKLQDRDAEVAALLSVLMTQGNAGSPVILLHPGGPLGAVRAGMVLADVAPALNVRASDLRQDLQELEQLSALQDVASGKLEEGLADLQSARSALSQAIADRKDLPKRFIADPVREAILIASADTLSRFAAGLDQITVDIKEPAPLQLDGQKGALPLPVQGEVVRRAGEADAAGISRPGIVLATQPRAIVTSPVSATLRYAGPLLDFGEVVILEPQAEVLFVLAGLNVVYGSAGDIVNAGDPLGLMSDVGHKNAAELSTDGDQAGAAPLETLYIEVRHKNTPEDPSTWFLIDKDG